MTLVETAILTLKNALKEDPDYRRVWVDNIAVCFQDAYAEGWMHGGVHKISNAGAERFLNLLCAESRKDSEAK